MLPRNWRFYVVNKTGVSIDLDQTSTSDTLEISYRGWKLTSAGAVEFQSAEQSLTFSSADVANDARAELTAVDNSSNLFMGLHGVITAQIEDSSADGTLDVYIEGSTDGGTTFPSDAADFDPEKDATPVCQLEIVTDGAGYVRAKSFEV